MSGLVKMARYYGQGRQHADPGALEARLAAVEQELAAVREELSETQEHLDFAERLLSQAREGTRLGPSE